MTRRGERIALVTGANRGLGREIARRLAGGGATVLLGSRDRKRGETAAWGLRREGAAVTPVLCDVTDSSSIAALARRIGSEHGRLDVLVNNAVLRRDESGERRHRGGTPGHRGHRARPAPHV
jgi:NAD(P)-dependent dehydrogenase (short-subunit alcohol dehydrogenase family)